LRRKVIAADPLRLPCCCTAIRLLQRLPADGLTTAGVSQTSSNPGRCATQPRRGTAQASRGEPPRVSWPVSRAVPGRSDCRRRGRMSGLRKVWFPSPSAWAIQASAPSGDAKRSLSRCCGPRPEPAPGFGGSQAKSREPTRGANVRLPVPMHQEESFHPV